jgi:radical SAM protein with 4Fe4S-binding SPASM domain
MRTPNVTVRAGWGNDIGWNASGHSGSCAQSVHNGGIMSLVRLAKSSFVRKYEDIGYIVNEISQKDLVVDECGAVFLSELGREARHIQAAAKSIAARFIDANQEDVVNDLREFVSQLEADGFVITGQTIDELDRKEPVFSYSRLESKMISQESLYESHTPSSEVLKQHFLKYPRLFNMQIELTSFCNLRCVHCYLGDDHIPGGILKDKIICLLDQLKDIGALELTFTGGEAFSRADLPEILRHARHNDFSITLLTNNTLLTDSLIETIKTTGVKLVQVSVYSMKPEVHDAITRQAGSWKKTIDNIEMLTAHDVPIQIGCPIMKENFESFDEVITWGRSMRFRVKPDLSLMARTDFSTGNLIHRLDLGECKKALRRIIASDVEYRERLALSSLINKRPNPCDPICGVGASTLCMAANGDFYPCPGFQMKLGNITIHSVMDVWSNSPLLQGLRKVNTSAYPTCLTCQSLEYCHICMAAFYNESGGDIYKPSAHFCGVSHLRRELSEV